MNLLSVIAHRHRTPVSNAVTFVGATPNTYASASSISATVPSSVQAGDLLIAAATIRAGQSLSTPSGWTLVNNTVGVGTSNVKQYLFRKTAVAGDAGATLTVSTTLGEAIISLSISAYRKVGGLTVKDSNNGSSAAVSGTSTTVTCPLSTSLNDMLICAATTAKNATSGASTGSADSPWVNDTVTSISSSSASNSVYMMVAHTPNTSTTTAQTCTFTIGATQTSNDWATVSCVIG